MRVTFLMTPNLGCLAVNLLLMLSKLSVVICNRSPNLYQLFFFFLPWLPNWCSEIIKMDNSTLLLIQHGEKWGMIFSNTVLNYKTGVRNSLPFYDANKNLSYGGYIYTYHSSTIKNKQIHDKRGIWIMIKPHGGENLIMKDTSSLVHKVG